MAITVEPGLEAQADWVLAQIEGLRAAGVRLDDGKRIPVGWSMLTFRRQADGSLHAFEPDFSPGSSSTERPGATETLRMQALQLGFANLVGAKPETTGFRDKVVLEKGCLAEDDLYMTREPPVPAKGDSGWFIGARRRRDSEAELEAIFAYQLLQLRPELFPALILPAGSMVAADRLGIERVANSSNVMLYQRQPRESK